MYGLTPSILVSCELSACGPPLRPFRRASHSSPARTLACDIHASVHSPRLSECGRACSQALEPRRQEPRLCFIICLSDGYHKPGRSHRRPPQRTPTVRRRSEREARMCIGSSPQSLEGHRRRELYLQTASLHDKSRPTPQHQPKLLNSRVVGKRFARWREGPGRMPPLATGCVSAGRRSGRRRRRRVRRCRRLCHRQRAHRFPRPRRRCRLRSPPSG